MKKLVIMGGLPGSGKSFVRNNLERLNGLTVVDCDQIKKTLKNYDPKDPETTHAQSKVVEKQQIYTLLANGESFVYDTTATNSDKVVAMTKQAQSLGYTVEMIYVKVTLNTSLTRNANRERVVAESIIMDKYSKIQSAMEIAERFVDTFTIVEND
jgi:predicted ABC-type ATPase